MSKPVSLKKNAIANYIGQFYTMFIGIFMLPFYLKYLGAEAYGLVGFFTVFMSWMTLLDLGLSTTLARETAKLKDKVNGIIELKRMTLSIEVFFVIISIIVFNTMFFGSTWLSMHWLEVKELSYITVESTIKIMAFLLVFRWFIGLYQGAIIGFEHHVWLNIYKIIFATIKFLGAFLLIVFITKDIIHFFYFQLVVTIFEFVVIKFKIDSYMKISEKVFPSFMVLKQMAPFALSIAYTSSMWVFITQLDKLMLSHYLPLDKYGFFTLVIIISGAILQIFHPIGQAILPRMTSLLSNGQEKEMLVLYHKATQIVSIVVFSVSGTIAVFSYELLYSWTGNIEASQWGSPILFWYALGNASVSLLSFQFYMQYAYGNLKYHVKGNTYFGFIQIIAVILSVHFYGALGAALTWFGLQTFFLLWWPGFIHSKFAPSIHKDWVFKDILPILLVSVMYLWLLKSINMTFSENRWVLFFTLIGLGFILLVLNTVVSKEGRRILSKISIMGLR
ncbi:oligosaccharide flippase family protein [Aliarcobacter butzleri]|uniref:oligosaccharide flippase family protein n=1 Tax=Aliarcobacter butzleri TaxID=28197 RepID=UPI001EDB0F45|nr:oligosaccharide flippase family protein [Aliarcobacter butzleri]MCG3710617.1 oligosaccharide flippase family protein [Aliarcobacter butzleri]MCG3714122.1 oligosaccharide flippase family protein [Aliarcobacter butzleri]